VAFTAGARQLTELGVTLYATPGSARFLQEQGIEATSVGWPDDEGSELTAKDLLLERRVDLVINIPKSNQIDELSNDVRIRRDAVDHNIPLITNIQLAARLAAALAKVPPVDFAIKALDDY
jgi:carbamoyl-phosphate synthase large subunit